MLEKVTFRIVRPGDNRRYTHFITDDGKVEALYKLNTLHEAVVGVIKDFDFPNEAQTEQIRYMAGQATCLNPTVTLKFEEGTSPFEAVVSPDTVGLGMYLELLAAGKI